MNLAIFCRSSKISNSRSAERMTAAERELSAFFNAVKQSFGRGQAELSAEDWINELTKVDGFPASTRDLRRITAKAATRLAIRVKASPLSAEFTNA